MAEPITNWGGNIRYSTDRLHTPADAAEVGRLIALAGRAKAMGTRHTFNPVGDTTGELISTRLMNRVLHFDPDRQIVTVEPGITYGQLGAYLHERGYALNNLPSLPHVCVGGAVQTATHGSGTQNLSADVVDITYSNAPPTPAAPAGPEGRGEVVALGLLGIATQLSLRVRKAFVVQQDIYEHVPLADLAANFDAVMRAAYSVSFFTDWQTDRVNQAWFKHDVTAGGPPPLHFPFLAGKLAKRKLHPIAAVDPVNCTEQGLPGPAHERLPHFRHDREPSSAGQELQAEYFVKRSDAPAAMQAIAAVGKRLRQVLMISEIRTVMADGLWLSPAYRTDVVGIHFTMQPDLPAVLAVLTGVIEPALAPFNPRPHWGKLFTLDAADVRARYPMLERFGALCRQYDPAGRFRNDFAERYVFAGES